MKNLRQFKTALAIIFVALFFSRSVAAQQATVTDLGAFYDDVSSAVDINNTGLAVINLTDDTGENRAFVYRIATGEKITIPTLGGRYGLANAINNSGKVVGNSETSGGDMHAFLYDTTTGQITDLHESVSLGGNGSSATAINDSGVIAGFALADTIGDISHAFVYDPSAGRRIDIGTLGGTNSWAAGINNAGVVVGKSLISETLPHAFRYELSTGTLTDIGTLGSDIEVYRINNNNQVVGLSYDSSNKLKAFRSGGKINPATDILLSGTDVDNMASGINDRDEVVGKSGPAAMVDSNYAFLYSGGTTKNLNLMLPPGSNVTLTEGIAINNFGQILANGILQTPNSSIHHAYLVTLTYSVSGIISDGTAPLSGVSVNLSAGSTASTTTNVNGEYFFTGLRAGGNYTITPTLINYIFTPPNQVFNSLSANQTANFTATNTCSYSINPASVNPDANSSTSSVAVTAPTGCAWTAASNVSWLTISSGASGSGNGSVGYSVAANSGTAQSGTITIAGQTFTVNQAAATPSYEADVTPRSTADGVVDATDVQQIERFSIGFDKPYQLNEGQRADCAPRSVNGAFVGGDGQVDATDVQQAERYSIGFDPKTLSGGPTTINAPEMGSVLKTNRKDAVKDQLAAPRTLSIQSVSADAGQNISVNILADIMNDEAGYTFSVSYDQSKLTNPQITKGSIASETILSNAATAGQIGFSVRNGGATFPAGNSQVLVTVTFTAAANAMGGATPINFTDTPAAESTSDANAQPLTTNYVNGTVTINSPTAAAATVSGRVLSEAGRGIRNVVVTMTDTSGNQRRATSTAFGYYRFENVATGETYIFTVSGKRFALSQNRIVKLITEDTNDVNFIAAGERFVLPIN